MKPATSALFDWMKIIITNKFFKYCIIKHAQGEFCGSSHEHYYYISAINVPEWKYNREKPALMMVLTTNENHIDVAVTIEVPEILCWGKYEGHRRYYNLKIKDIISFMKLANETAKGNYNIYEIYYTNPEDFVGEHKTQRYIETHPEAYNRFMNYKNSMFDFLDKCEKQNIALKNIKKDF